MNARLYLLATIFAASPWFASDKMLASSPSIDSGFTFPDGLDRLSPVLSNFGDDPIYCSSVQFRLGLAVIPASVEATTNDLCSVRRIDAQGSFEARSFSIDSKSAIRLENLDRSYLPDLVNSRLSQGLSNITSFDGSSYSLQSGNVADPDRFDSGRLAYCPVPSSVESSCTIGCAPGERLRSGICQRELIRNMAWSRSGSCMLKADGRPICWGNQAVQIPSNLGPFLELDGQGPRLCAQNADGQQTCFGQLDATTALDSESRWIEYRFGAARACGITQDRLMFCFGDDSLMPLSVMEENTFASVGMSDRQVCGLRQDGSLVCWRGRNIQTTPLDGQKVLAIDGGRRHICALRDDYQLICWGDRAGDLASQVPVDLGVVKSFSVGDYHSCAVDQDRKVRCWGQNDSGQLTVPSTLRPVKAVYAGPQNTCVTNDIGVLTCWGSERTGVNAVPAELR